MDKIKVLIAEDSMTQAMQLQHILEKNGYDATVVSNGSEALQSISKSKPSDRHFRYHHAGNGRL